MTRAITFALIPIALLLGMPATGAPATHFRGGHPADRQALLAVSEEWVRAFRSGDVDALLKLYAEDAVLMSPDQPRIAGARAIRESFTQLLAAPQRSIVIHVDEIGIDSRHAWASVLGVIRYQLPGAPRREYVSRTFLVYERNSRGEWRILRDLDQPTPDAGFLKDASDAL